jgi:hypothetical protein
MKNYLRITKIQPTQGMEETVSSKRPIISLTKTMEVFTIGRDQEKPYKILSNPPNP